MQRRDTEGAFAPSADPWQPTAATVVECRPDIFSVSFDPPTAPEYLVTFSYDVAGHTYTGAYRAGTRYEPGESFQILYDSRNPSQNTRSDRPRRLRSKVLIVVFGAGLGALLIWLENYLQ